MGLEANSAGQYPVVARTAYVHPTAVLIGHVIVKEDVFIGPLAVLRADEPGPDKTIAPIIVNRRANIQDGVIVHALGGTSVDIGAGASIAHGAIVHGPCAIGKRCFVGFSSIVFRACLADDVIVLHRALVENVEIARDLLVPSTGRVQSDADLPGLAPASAEMVAFARKVRRMNVWLAQANLHQRQRSAAL